MKLTIIWTTPAIALTERLRRTADWLALTAAHALPKRVAYWAYIRVGSRAMRPDQVVPEALFVDLLARAER